MACIDRAPATAEYIICYSSDKMERHSRQLRVWDTIPMAYEAAKERLERKFEGDRWQVAWHLEEIDNFRPAYSGNSKNLEKFADPLDIALVNLRG